MQWIKEVELVDSVDELRSSSSTRGISMPNFEVLDARIASALNKIIHNSQFKRRVSLCKYHQKGRCKCGDECRFQHSLARKREHERQERKGQRQALERCDSCKSSSNAIGTPSGGKGFDKDRCKLCNEITDPPHSAAMCTRALAVLKTHGASTSSASTSVQQTTSESAAQVPALEIKDMEQIVSLATCLTKLNKNIPVNLSANMIRVKGTCMSCHAQKRHVDDDC